MRKVRRISPSLSGLKLVWDVKLVAIIKGWPSINMKVIIHCLGIFKPLKLSNGEFTLN
jgi:hypothetical protein